MFIAISSCVKSFAAYGRVILATRFDDLQRGQKPL